MKIELTFEKTTPKGSHVYKGKRTVVKQVEKLTVKGKKKEWTMTSESSEEMVKVYAPFLSEAIRIDDKEFKSMRNLTQGGIAIPNLYWF